MISVYLTNTHIDHESALVILCLLTFLINIKDETTKYIILNILLSESIPENTEKYIIQILFLNIKMIEEINFMNLKHPLQAFTMINKLIHIYIAIKQLILD